MHQDFLPQSKEINHCENISTCGGCSFKDISYFKQLLNKKESFLEKCKQAGIDLPEKLQIVSTGAFSYRTRMDFAFCDEGVGLKGNKNYKLVTPIKTCLIANKKINNLLKEVWVWHDSIKENLIPYTPTNFKGTFKFVVIRAPEHTEETSVSFILNRDADELLEQLKYIDIFVSMTSAKNVYIGYVGRRQELSVTDDIRELKGSRTLSEKLDNKILNFDSQSFFQNNTAGINSIITYIKKYFKTLNLKGFEFVDLYGGAGTFGITLGALFKKYYILDNASKNIDCARENVKKITSTTGEVLCGDAVEFDSFGIKKENHYVFIIDPPRAGLHFKALNKIISFAPEHLVYISCNPNQTIKELPRFLKHYKLIKIQLFDLFPQTNHFESVFIFVKK